jgi:methionyl-tRNA formyltransferase
VDIVPSLASEDVASELKRAAPDLLVSWFWTKKIPKKILSIPKLGALGVHPSLLPRHRGPDPYFWAIDAGDDVSGVTAHRLDEEYDTGEIIDTSSLTIDPEWNAWTHAKKLDRPSLQVLRRVVGRIAKEGSIESRPQSDGASTDAPAPRDEDLLLSFDWDAEKIVRRVRAASPWPGAFFDFGGRLLTVTKARVTREFPSVLEPGEAALVEGRLVVRASDDAVVIDAARDENDEILGENGLRALFGSIVEVEKKQL